MTAYIKKINEILIPQKRNGIKILDLFAGCGGLALGFEALGFETIGYEMEADYCATYKHNLKSACHQIVLDKNTDLPKTDIIIGGPPCQPFSVGGKQHGLKDARDGFPAFIAAVKRNKPKLWIIENVRGLLYKNLEYFHEILETLDGLGYFIEYKLTKFQEYGIPQNRERVIIVGHRGNYHFPEATNERVTAGDALGDLAFQIPNDAKFLTTSMDAYIKKYEIASKCINPRDLHLDKPARTLTCRNLAGATGDMHRIKLSDGRRRRITVREAARLQSFPDWYQFLGNEQSQYYQIGNAVPPLFSYQLAESVKQYLEHGINQKRTITKDSFVRINKNTLSVFEELEREHA